MLQSSFRKRVPSTTVKPSHMDKGTDILLIPEVKGWTLQLKSTRDAYTDPGITQSSDTEKILIHIQQKIIFIEDFRGSISLLEDADFFLCSEALKQESRGNTISLWKQAFLQRKK